MWRPPLLNSVFCCLTIPAEFSIRSIRAVKLLADCTALASRSQASLDSGPNLGTLPPESTQAYVAKIANSNPASVGRIHEVYLIRLQVPVTYYYGLRSMHHIRAKKDDWGMPLWQEQAECRCCRFPLIKLPADTAPASPGNSGLIGHDFFNESGILRHRQTGRYAFRSFNN